jgi:MFS family permease
MTTMEGTEATAAATTAAGGPGLLRPLRVRDFRLVFAGETVSVLGDQFHFVALAWLTLQLTGSGLALGSVLMVAAIPRLIFLLLGGALSDRWSPRSLMLYSNVLRAVLVGILAFLVLTGRAELWQLYVIGAIFGVVDALFYPALSAIVPMLVNAATLPPANALLQGSQQFAALIGPALAGVVVALVQTGPAFVVDSISFAVAAIAIVFVLGGRRVAKQAGSEGGEKAPSILATIGAGLRYAWSDPAVRSLVLLSAAFNFAFTGPLSVGLPFMAEHTLGGGSATFGILLSGFGAGALLGAVTAGSIRRVPRLGTTVLLIAIGLGLGLGLIGLAPNVIVAFGLLAAMGVGAGFLNVHVISWLQARTPEDKRGRVMSLVMIGSHGLAPVSYALAGLIVDVGPVPLMFGVAGAIVVVASLAGFASGVARQMAYATDEEAAA